MKIAKLKDINEAELKSEKPWKDIKTAPHDRRILLWTGNEVYVGHWGKNIGNDDDAFIVAEFNDGSQILVKAIKWKDIGELPKEGKQ